MKTATASILAALLIVLICIVTANLARASECPTYTTEQTQVLRNAWDIGLPHDRQHTLMAIVEREAFVGPYVIRVTSTDGDHGSYGVAMMQLTTAMHLTGEDSSWRARAELAPRMMQDDTYALQLAMLYLLRHERLGWAEAIRRYNGSGAAAERYAAEVSERVNLFVRCGRP